MHIFLLVLQSRASAFNGTFYTSAHETNTMETSRKSFPLLTTVLFCTFIQISSAQSPVPSSAVVQKLNTGFLQPEDLWVDTIGLLFSDIIGNKIYCWSTAASAMNTFLCPSDSSNGLTLDHEGRLILTQMRLRRVSRQEFNGTITPLAATFRGKKFNSPNDVVVKSDGSIFFTDPDFNIPYPHTSELNFQGIYRISPLGTVSLLDSTLDKPNGICFSLDEKKLYVNDSHACIIYVWDVVDDSTISNKRIFYTVPPTGYVDGMKIDSAGNLFCAGPTDIWIVSDSGKYLDKIPMPETPSNCAWGDTTEKHCILLRDTVFIKSDLRCHRCSSRSGTTSQRIPALSELSEPVQSLHHSSVTNCRRTVP